MKKAKKSITLAFLLLLLLSVTWMPGLRHLQTAKASPVDITTRLIGGTSSMPSDGAIVSVAGFGSSSYFIDAVGTVYAYGTNTSGELGDGSTVSRKSVAPVTRDSDMLPLTGIDRIWSNHNYGIFGYDYDTDTLYGWGKNVGFRIDKTKPTTATVNRAVVVDLPVGVKLSKQPNAIAVGTQHVLLLDQNGHVWSWGQMHDTTQGKENENRLGYDFDAATLAADHAGEFETSGTFTYMKVPHPVPLPLKAGETVQGVYMGWVGINYALTSEGRVLSWGGNNTANLNVATQYGENFTEINKPADVDDGFTYTKIAVGKSSNVVMLGNDGKVYVLNGYTYMGVVSGTSKTPILASQLDYDVNDDGVEDVTYVDVASGADNATTDNTVAAMAVRSDNTVWVWGNGISGRLGDGNFAANMIRDPASQISTLIGFTQALNNPTDYKDSSVSWYFNHGLLLKNGLVYAWGQNTSSLFYPMTVQAEQNSTQSVFPRMVDYNLFPAALKYDGTGYPSDTPVADTDYALNKVDLSGGTMEVTVSGLNDGLNGKQVIFYNENQTEYGRANVINGTASLQISGLTNEQSIQVFVKSNDTLQKLWAPALHAKTFTYALDALAPIVIGVYPDAYYNTDRTITFNEGTATLNGVSFESGSTVSQEGTYTLVVTNTDGKTTTIHFTIDKTDPVVMGVEPDGLYHAPVTITFDQGTAQLNNATFESGDTISIDGLYTLVVTDDAGNITTLSFSIENVFIDWSLNGDTLSNISEKTSADAFIHGIHTVATTTIAIKTLDGNMVTGPAIVGTNMTAELQDRKGLTFATYKLVILGDVTGNGLINSTDLLVLKRHLLGYAPLTGAFTQAANVTRKPDGSIDALDLVAIEQHVLGQKSIGPAPTPMPSPTPIPMFCPFTSSYSPEQINNLNRYYNRSVLNSEGDEALAAVIRKAQRGEPVTLGLIGGSITLGAGSGSADASYAGWILKWWKYNFPNTPITLVNAGIGNTGSFIGVHRSQDQLFSKNPDLVIIEFSVNDTQVPTNANYSLDLESYESLVRRALSQPQHPAVLLLATCNQSGSTLQSEHLLFAQRYHLPLLSEKDAILADVTNGTYYSTTFFADGVHPNPNGHFYLGNLVNYHLQRILNNLDTIGDPVFNPLPDPQTAARFVDANIILPDELTLPAGWSIINSTVPPLFTHVLSPAPGSAPLSLDINAANISLLIKKVASSNSSLYGDAYVIIDGTRRVDFNSFIGTDTHPVTVQLITDGTEPAPHHIEIFYPAEGNEGKSVYIIGIMTAGQGS